MASTQQFINAVKAHRQETGAGLRESVFAIKERIRKGEVDFVQYEDEIDMFGFTVERINGLTVRTKHDQVLIDYSHTPGSCAASAPIAMDNSTALALAAFLVNRHATKV